MAQVIGLLPLLSPSCSCSGSWERNLQMGMSSLSMSLLLNFFRKKYLYVAKFFSESKGSNCHCLVCSLKNFRRIISECGKSVVLKVQVEKSMANILSFMKDNCLFYWESRHSVLWFTTCPHSQSWVTQKQALLCRWQDPTRWPPSAPSQGVHEQGAGVEPEFKQRHRNMGYRQLKHYLNTCPTWPGPSTGVLGAQIRKPAQSCY